MRPLGIPTVADRIAQEVARRYLEPRLEPVFHTGSYGYRPGRSATAGYLSGGERQMLAIAQALLCKPRLILVDELSLGLAPFLVKELMARLSEMREKFKLSILLIEQDASSALAIADYGYIMEGGRVVFEGTVDQLRSHGDVQEFYLGSGDSARDSYRDVKQYRRSRRWWG